MYEKNRTYISTHFIQLINDKTLIHISNSVRRLKSQEICKISWNMYNFQNKSHYWGRARKIHIVQAVQGGYNSYR